jgi:multidrug efflux pump subunit AcrA (membrane-fusion protein)
MISTLKRRSPAAGLALALCLAGCGAKEEQPAKPVVEVRVARVETATVAHSLRASASIFPRAQASVAARVTATIRRLGVHKGEDVAAGQALAELENRDLVAQRQEAAAMVADARASLEKTTTGTLPADVERARGQLSITEAALNQARRIHDRREELYKAGAIPGRDLLTAETDVARAKAEYEVARQSLDLLEHQSGQRDIQMARSRLDQAEARLAGATAQLQFTEIRSPFAGTITEQFMYPGDMAKPDAPMLVVMDLSTVIARAQAPEAKAAALRGGQACAFSPSDSPAAVFAGRVTVVSRAVDPARRTVEVWCEIPNPTRALRANVFGEVTIQTGSDPGSLVVPQAAVEFAEGTAKGTVVVVDQGRIAHRREIEAGEVSDGRVQVRSGLKAGEVVVVEGGYGVPDGAEVRPQ